VRADKAYDYTFLFPKGSRYDYLTDYVLLRKWIREGKLKDFKILHINTWENILQFDNKKDKYPGQITIAEAHGFFVGVNFDATLRELPLQKRIPNFMLKLLANNKMQKRLREYDIFYYSTPNMEKHAKKIRKDATWLPNPIDTNIFYPKGPKVNLEGDPAIFFPTRLHAFKNPLFGVNLFKKIRKKYPKAKLHMINYGLGADPLFNAFKRMVDKNDVVYHERMPREELAKYYRSADLVLGQFNPLLANLSMIELEAMACGAPLVTLDIYQIKDELASLENLEKLAFKILGDKKFRIQFIERNAKYVLKIHSEKAVTKLNNQIISEEMKRQQRRMKKKSI